jgi:hypothetical protein
MYQIGITAKAMVAVGCPATSDNWFAFEGCVAKTGVSQRPDDNVRAHVFLSRK